MEKRIPYQLKGKGLARGYSPPPRKRIRAPDLDTSTLIEENALTLIGRLTNPSAQRLWSLFPFLSNRWNLKGKAVGSDLGRGCFQFRFDFEEDLQKVLDNRPYHYDQWMVIIQKWEPIISDSFPSMIPFWVELQGLPKHFWQPEMLQTIGEEIGEVITSEITTSSAKLRVLINGLQPLTKETIVDFRDGSEAIVYLEYKNLKNHCLHCHRLTHDQKDCPGLISEKENSAKPSSTNHSPGSKALSRNYYTPRDNFVAPREKWEPSGRRDISQENSSFHAHHKGNPVNRGLSQRKEGSYNRHYSPRRAIERNYERTASRELDSHYQHRRGNRYSENQSLQWREKTPSIPTSHHELSDSSRTRRPPLERNLPNLDSHTPPLHLTNQTTRRRLSPTLASPPPVIPSKEQVMSELREVTVQYTTCADPTESAARKQRVLQGEAKNLMDNTATLIIQAAAASAPPVLSQQALQDTAQPENRITLSEEHPPTANSSGQATKRGRGRPPLSKPANKPVSKLKGVRSQKRILTSGSPKRPPTQKTTSPKRTSQAGPSGSNPAHEQITSKAPGQKGKTGKSKATNHTDPQITLIPAMKKKTADFQNPPTLIP